MIYTREDDDNLSNSNYNTREQSEENTNVKNHRKLTS